MPSQVILLPDICTITILCSNLCIVTLYLCNGSLVVPLSSPLKQGVLLLLKSQLIYITLCCNCILKFLLKQVKCSF